MCLVQSLQMVQTPIGSDILCITQAAKRALPTDVQCREMGNINRTSHRMSSSAVVRVLLVRMSPAHMVRLIAREPMFDAFAHQRGAARQIVRQCTRAQRAFPNQHIPRAFAVGRELVHIAVAVRVRSMWHASANGISWGTCTLIHMVVEIVNTSPLVETARDPIAPAGHNAPSTFRWHPCRYNR